MKKFVITVSLGIIILLAILVILLGLRSRNEDGAKSSYRFLDGRSPVAFRGEEKWNKDRRYTYSFEADFNDVCLKAKSEGFIGGVNFFGNDFSGRYFSQKNKFPRGPVLIYIYRNCQYVELPDSKEGSFCEKEGWVRVEIVYFRGWRWPF